MAERGPDAEFAVVDVAGLIISMLETSMSYLHVDSANVAVSWVDGACHVGCFWCSAMRFGSLMVVTLVAVLVQVGEIVR